MRNGLKDEDKAFDVWDILRGFWGGGGGGEGTATIYLMFVVALHYTRCFTSAIYLLFQ